MIPYPLVASTRPDRWLEYAEFHQDRVFMHWTLSRDGLWVSEFGGRTQHVPPKVMAWLEELLRRDSVLIGCETGTWYDGTAYAAVHENGRVREASYNYEVEMGARCGLGHDDNLLLDAARNITLGTYDRHPFR